MKTLLVFLGAFGLSMLLPLSSSAKIFLRTSAQESSPKYFKQGSRIQGYCADILRAIEEIDPEIRFTGDQSFLPFPRILKRLEIGELDIFCGLQYSKEREALYNYLAAPMILVRGKLVTRADDVVAPESLDEIATIKGDNTILTIKGTAVVQILKKVPRLKIDQSPVTIDQALQMLLAKRGRFVFYQDMAIMEALQKMEILNKVKVMPKVFYYEGLYMGTSKKLDPVKTQRLRAACEILQSSGKLQQILEKYPVIRPDNYPRLGP